MSVDVSAAGPVVSSAGRERPAIRKPPPRVGSIVGRVVRWIVLLAFSALFLYPFAWLLAASFKPRGQVFDNALIPKTFQPQNYADVFNELPLFNWVGNSLLIALAEPLKRAIDRPLVPDSAKRIAGAASSASGFPSMAMPRQVPAARPEPPSPRSTAPAANGSMNDSAWAPDHQVAKPPAPATSA